MKNKTCAKCNAVNGERATYCRKCGAILDDAVVTEVTKRGNAPRNTKPASRPADYVTAAARPGPKSRPMPKSSMSDDHIILPKRPAKPRVIYWPFVVSLVSGFIMLGLIVAFVLGIGNDDDAPASGTASSVVSTSASTTQTEAPADISEITIGDIADQVYTGDPITIPFSLQYNDVMLEEGVDYTITYEDNIPIGTATVYFEGTGERYTGSFSTTFNIISNDEVCDDPVNHDVNIFVMRIYWTMVDRSPTLDELIEQVHRIRNEEVTGVEFINEITFCDEAVNRQLSDMEFVNAFYQGALARPADQAGLEYNTELLEGGMSREALVNNILNTEGGEFESICNSLDITLN